MLPKQTRHDQKDSKLVLNYVFLESLLKSIRVFIYVLNLSIFAAYSSFALSNETRLLGLWDFYVATTKGVQLVETEVSGIS